MKMVPWCTHFTIDNTFYPHILYFWSERTSWSTGSSPPPPPSLKGTETVAVYPSLLRIFDLHFFIIVWNLRILSLIRTNLRFCLISGVISKTEEERSCLLKYWRKYINSQLRNQPRFFPLSHLNSFSTKQRQTRSRWLDDDGVEEQITRSTLFMSIDRHEVHQKNSPFAWMIAIKTRIHFVFSFVLKFDNPVRLKFAQESKTVKDSWSSSIIIMTPSSPNISTSLLIIETLRSTVSAYGNG